MRKSTHIVIDIFGLCLSSLTLMFFVHSWWFGLNEWAVIYVLGQAFITVNWIYFLIVDVKRANEN